MLVIAFADTISVLIAEPEYMIHNIIRNIVHPKLTVHNKAYIGMFLRSVNIQVQLISVNNAA